MYTYRSVTTTNYISVEREGTDTGGPNIGVWGYSHYGTEAHSTRTYSVSETGEDGDGSYTGTYSIGYYRHGTVTPGVSGVDEISSTYSAGVTTDYTHPASPNDVETFTGLTVSRTSTAWDGRSTTRTSVTIRNGTHTSSSTASGVHPVQTYATTSATTTGTKKWVSTTRTTREFLIRTTDTGAGATTTQAFSTWTLTAPTFTGTDGSQETYLGVSRTLSGFNLGGEALGVNTTLFDIHEAGRTEVFWSVTAGDTSTFYALTDVAEITDRTITFTANSSLTTITFTPGTISWVNTTVTGFTVPMTVLPSTQFNSDRRTLTYNRIVGGNIQSTTTTYFQLSTAVGSGAVAGTTTQTQTWFFGPTTTYTATFQLTTIGVFSTFLHGSLSELYTETFHERVFLFSTLTLVGPQDTEYMSSGQTVTVPYFTLTGREVIRSPFNPNVTIVYPKPMYGFVDGVSLENNAARFSTFTHYTDASGGTGTISFSSWGPAAFPGPGVLISAVTGAYSLATAGEWRFGVTESTQCPPGTFVDGRDPGGLLVATDVPPIASVYGPAILLITRRDVTGGSTVEESYIDDGLVAFTLGPYHYTFGAKKAVRPLASRSQVGWGHVGGDQDEYPIIELGYHSTTLGL